jgi:hypothetical protein
MHLRIPHETFYKMATSIFCIHGRLQLLLVILEYRAQPSWINFLKFIEPCLGFFEYSFKGLLINSLPTSHYMNPLSIFSKDMLYRKTFLTSFTAIASSVTLCVRNPCIMRCLSCLKYCTEKLHYSILKRRWGWALILPRPVRLYTDLRPLLSLTTVPSRNKI